jgi:hypothetical protein
VGAEEGSHGYRFEVDPSMLLPFPRGEVENEGSNLHLSLRLSSGLLSWLSVRSGVVLISVKSVA